MPMKSKDLIAQSRAQFSTAFMAAIKEGNEQGVADALASFSQGIQEAFLDEAREMNAAQQADAAALASRGIRMLTSQENKYYNKVIEAMNAKDPQMALTNIDVVMPETVIDSVMDDIQSRFPLLEEIDFVNSTAISRWLFNAQEAQQAKWGKLTSAVTEELSGAFRSLETGQFKLTAFMLVSKDYLALGPAWLDRYVRAILVEANGLAMEDAAVSGDGSVGPVGMDRDIDKGATSDGVTTYPQKAAVEVTSLDPVTYGGLIAPLTLTPTKRRRRVTQVLLVVNPVDYLTKVMPATTVLRPDGTYANDVFPFPTKVVQSGSVDEGKAVLGIPGRYLMTMGTPKEGVITYDDSYKFLEDMRTYMTKLLGNGRPKDNNSFVVLDISGLEALVPTVKTIAEPATASDTAPSETT